MSALLLYRQQTADLPPIQRLAAGGEIYARSERGQWRRLRRPGVSVPTDKGKRGQDTIWFPVPSCLRRQTAAMPGLPIGSHSSPAAARSTVS